MLIDFLLVQADKPRCNCNLTAYHIIFRAPHKREYLVIIRVNSSFSAKNHIVTPHLNRLNETVQMRGHNIWF